ncbi:MAG: hypothetical protein LBN95_08270 [Prevotellaceae bacterium]|jgi:hypothetical protein|nr:hypothetical protein [Prevotellaceae bacterium]
MKSKVIFTDAPPEVEEAFARSKRIPNFIDIHSLILREEPAPKPQRKRFSFPVLRKVAAM